MPLPSEGDIDDAVPASGTPNRASTNTVLKNIRGEVAANTSSISGQAAATQTLTNKTISGSSNTLTNLPAANISGVIPIANLATGTPDGTKFIRDDGTLQAIPGGGDALTSNPLSQFAATTSDQLRGVLSDETGTGAAVFATSPTLVTPNLGTPSAVDLANATFPSSIATLTGTQTLTNKTLTAPSISDPTLTGGQVITPAAMGALAIDTGEMFNTKTLSESSTLTFSATPATNATFGLWVTNSSGSAITVTIPSSFSVASQSTITSFSLAANGIAYLFWRYTGSAYHLLGVPVSAESVTLADITDMSANAQSFNAAADYSAMRTALGVAIGTNVQAYSSVLAALASASANGQSLVTAANYAAMRALLDLEIGTDVQAYSANLDEYAAVNPTTAGLALLDDATAGDQRTTLSAAARSQTTEVISGFIETPSDKTYKLCVKMPHGGTITETTTVSGSGTCTATFGVNTTNLGGTANSVSTSEQSQSHASANVFSAGDDIRLVISSNSSCADLSFSIQYTRTLA